MKVWHSARDLAELNLPGLPTRVGGMNKKARREGWREAMSYGGHGSPFLPRISFPSAPNSKRGGAATCGAAVAGDFSSPRILPSLAPNSKRGGGGWEYHINVLPVEARHELYRRYLLSKGRARPVWNSGQRQKHERQNRKGVPLKPYKTEPPKQEKTQSPQVEAKAPKRARFSLFGRFLRWFKNRRRS